MALDEKKLQELRGLLNDPELSPEMRTHVLAQIGQTEDEHLQGWADAAPVPGQNNAAAPGELGVQSVIGYEDAPAPELTPEEQEEAEMLSKFDSRFDLVPQGLALMPATTHPGGDKAAADQWLVGDPASKNVKYVYEPPVGVVRQQLLENPSLSRAIRQHVPPTVDEIANMDAGSSIYREVADYMFKQVADKAAETGTTVVRYSRAPWLQPGTGVIPSLNPHLTGGAEEALEQMGQAFVLGVDDVGAFGAGKAIQETVSPEDEMDPDADVMGLNEQSPQSREDMNRWAAEDNPLAHLAGQGTGLLAPWMPFNIAWRGISKGGEALAKVASNALPSLGAAGRVGGKLATGAGSAAAAGAVTQGATEAVDMGANYLQTGEPPSPERVEQSLENMDDSARVASLLGLGGAGLQQFSQYGANKLRHGNFAGGLIGETEPHMQYGVRGALFGPRLKPETQRFVEETRQAGYRQPGDSIAQEIAPPIAEVQGRRNAAADARMAAEDTAFQRTAEGVERLPMQNLQQETVNRLRARHQPVEGGLPIPVGPTEHNVARRQFNHHIAEVSTEAREGWIKLEPQEAERYLSARHQNEIWKRELSAAGEKAPKKAKAEPVDRDAYLQTIKDPKQRRAVSDEIDAEVDDILTDAKKSLDSPERAKVEQRVLRELVETQGFVEANGSLSDWLRLRGKDGIYVRPQAYDAARTETVIGDLDKASGDYPKLKKAAVEDRKARKKDGKPGAWNELKEAHAKEKGANAAAQEAMGKDTFATLVRHGRTRPGEKIEIDQLRSLADEAGVREQLDKLRALEASLQVQEQGSFFFGRGNQERRLAETAGIRAFPVLRALEGPLGPIGGGMAGRPAALREERDLERELGEQSARSRYERRRDRQMKKKQEEKERQ